jgi:ketosteroid isomerase-like protein
MNMDSIDIVKAYFAALNSTSLDQGDQYLAADYKLIAGTLEIDRSRFIAILTQLYAAIPDLTHVLSDIQVRGETVQLTDRPAGTFTGAWDGSSFGLPSIPPNGSAFHMAPMKWEITVRNGKITRWHDVTVPSAASGLPGFFKALGATPPAAKRWNA